MELLQNGMTALKWEDLTPNEQEFIEERSLDGRLDWLWILRNGYMSTIAFKRVGRQKDKSKRKLMVREAERFIQASGKRFVCSNLRYYNIAGWKTYFDEGEDLDHIYPAYEWYSKSNDGPWAWRGFTDEEFDEWFRQAYPYYKSKVPLSRMWFKQRHMSKPYAVFKSYMANLPDSELWFKLGLPQCGVSKTMCKMSQKTRKNALKWLKTNRDNLDDLNGFGFSIPEIQKCIKFNITPKQFLESKQMFEAMSMLKCDEKRAREVLKYLAKQRYGEIDHYRDYLTACKELGRNMEDRGVLYPRDFNQQFAELKRYKRKADLTQYDAEIEKRIADLNIPESTTLKGGFFFQVIKSGLDMFDIGEALHICVGTCGYNRKVADGLSVIGLVTKDGVPINCVELSTPKTRPYFTSIQNRGESNRPSQYQKQSEAIVAKYIRLANKQYKEAHA